MTENEILKHVAVLAHAGGLCLQDEADVLKHIRCLTLPHWRKDRTQEEMRQEVVAALRAAWGAACEKDRFDQRSTA